MYSSTKGLGRFGVIFDSHKASISEMSSWKQTLDIRFMLLAPSLDSFPLTDARGCAATPCGKCRVRRGLDSNRTYATNYSNVSFILIFVCKMRGLGWLSLSQTDTPLPRGNTQSHLYPFFGSFTRFRSTLKTQADPSLFSKLMWPWNSPCTPSSSLPQTLNLYLIRPGCFKEPICVNPKVDGPVGSCWPRFSSFLPGGPTLC